jgi:mannosylfructose-phosphate synthase
LGQKQVMNMQKVDVLPRIALVSTHGYVAANPPLGAADTGGQVVYVLELGKHLAQLGFEVDIFTRRFEDQPQFDHCAEHVRVVRLPCGGREFIPKEYLYRHLGEWCDNAIQYIREKGFSYTLINSHYWDGGLAGQCLAEAMAVPHIHTPHSLGIWKRDQMLSERPEAKDRFEAEFNFSERIAHERAIYNACEQIIATTPVQGEMLADDYGVPPNLIQMIPPGYDDSRFYPVSESTREMIRKRLGFEGKVVLALGRLATNKGYDLLVDGFAVLADREPEARLHLAVGGEQLDETEQAVLDGIKARIGLHRLTDKVILSGYVPSDQLADTYRAADMFVLSSRYEPFGMTAIEAMACGTPTVITTHGGLLKAVSYGRHALFADPLDPYDLGITMLKALRYEKLKGRLSRMGAHKARSLFTWSGIAQQLVAVAQGHGTLQPFEDNDWAEPWHEGD